MTAIAYIYALQDNNLLSHFTNVARARKEDVYNKKAFPMLEEGKHYIFSSNLDEHNANVLRRILGKPLAEYEHKMNNGESVFDLVWPLYI